jgi:phage shock protein C
MERKLYRSDDNKILLGICGGIGEYFNIDPVIVRIILVILIFLGFSGIIAYIVAAFIIPKKPTANYYPSSYYSKQEEKTGSTGEPVSERAEE